MARFLTADLPLRHCSCCNVKWLVVDLETTTLNPVRGEITSIGWVLINNGTIKLESAALLLAWIACYRSDKRVVLADCLFSPFL
ncbi:MAG: hypothetical protein JKY66_10470 [Spongiibacteraceae bacterium]|nr:hypothetical protein [Spongiibacteraceae bacterium]